MADFVVQGHMFSMDITYTSLVYFLIPETLNIHDLVFYISVKTFMKHTGPYNHHL